MLYYVKTGEISVKLNADNPKQAALKIVSSIDRSNLGICTIVCEKKINKSSTDDHIFFLTDSILDECNNNFMRLVC